MAVTIDFFASLLAILLNFNALFEEYEAKYTTEPYLNSRLSSGIETFYNLSYLSAYQPKHL